MDVIILEVAGMDAAIEAMRLPMKSGDKSDSKWDRYCDEEPVYVVGPADCHLSAKLIKAGSSHRKHLRLIDVWLKIRAPRYWWTEFDTYRVGVDKVSESTMHRILKDKISRHDFGGLSYPMFTAFLEELDIVNQALDEGSMDEATAIRRIKKVLPESYLQTRIVKCSYEALRNMYQERKSHRLLEWQEFCHSLKKLNHSEWITK